MYARRLVNESGAVAGARAGWSLDRGGAVEYDGFISSVQARSARPRDESEALVHATLRVLAQRLNADEANDLRAQLPGPLQGDLIPPEPEAQSFGSDEFVQRVARMAHLPEDEARKGMVAVLATTRDAVSPGEFDDVLAQLGEEFATLVPGSG
jgi:uncharacterized protein (DUF2267 family)